MRFMNMPNLHRASIFCGLAAAALFGASSALAEGGSPPVSGTTDAGVFSRKPYNITFDVRFGYDDNINTTAFNRQESAFANFQLGISYKAASPRSTLSIGAGVGVVYYFDREGGRSTDFNLVWNSQWSYKLTPRATINTSTYFVYQSQPDFALNFVGGLVDRRSTDYLYISSSYGLTYQWSRRFATVTSYKPVFIRYIDEPFSTQQDRSEHYFVQEFRFLLQPTVTFTGEYRFGYIDYSDISLDSRAHYLLAGIDATLSPRLKAGFRLGAEFRDYSQAGRGDYSGPYAEGTLSYDYQRNSNISFLFRYGIEQTDVVGSTNRNSFRLGINLRHQFTPRIGGYASFYYTRSNYEGSRVGFSTGDFNDNIYDVNVGLRYAVNRNWSVELGYLHTTVNSDIFGRGYDRNRVFVGGRFSF